jgi:hypothetical protein
MREGTTPPAYDEVHVGNLRLNTLSRAEGASVGDIGNDTRDDRLPMQCDSVKSVPIEG